VFETQQARSINEARMDHLATLGLAIEGRSVLDVGCGVGHLAQFFVRRGCRVTCVDARLENIEKLRSLYPGLEAHVANVEADRLAAFGRFDIVFCYGLLYHLEDPVGGLRNLAEACGDLVLLETVVSDCAVPISRLVDEPRMTANQAMGGLGCRPAPAFVVMALRRIGFQYVYAPVKAPHHPDFEFEWRDDLEPERNGHLLRCIFVASRREIGNSQLALLPCETQQEEYKARTRAAAAQARRVWLDLEENLTFKCGDPTERLLRQAQELAFVRPLGPYPAWSFGADWERSEPEYQRRKEIWQEFNRRRIEAPLAYEWYYGLRLNLYLGNDLSRQLFIGGCADPNEFAFLDRFLKAGMVVIDAGANDGIYTLFCAQRTSPSGQVLSFEPSQREFSRLQNNVELNQLRNIRMLRVALSNEDGEAQLQVAGHEHEGNNSLGAFAHRDVELLRTESVTVRSLDSIVAESGLDRIDFLKLDIEGAEVKALKGARATLREFRPVLLFEAFDDALREQGGSRDELLQLVRDSGYTLYSFNSEGLPCPAVDEATGDNLLATPLEKPLPSELCGLAAAKPKPPPISLQVPSAAEFRPGIACWNQRNVLAVLRERVLTVYQAVNSPGAMTPYQYVQLIASALEFRPDLILELGRGRGNSTCAFTEASNQLDGAIRVFSICPSTEWKRFTVPRLRSVVADTWFATLEARTASILEADYEGMLAGAGRVMLYWNAHGFDVAECVLGGILPLLASVEHLVMMHNLSDTRYASRDHMEYGPGGLWRGNYEPGTRVKIGHVDSSAAQAISALDFATRNQLTLESADHSLRTDLSQEQQEQMRALLGDLFDTQAHWFFFTLKEHAGPYTFPRFRAPRRGWKWKK